MLVLPHETQHIGRECVSQEAAPNYVVSTNHQSLIHCGRVSGGYFKISQPATPPSSHLWLHFVGLNLIIYIHSLCTVSQTQEHQYIKEKDKNGRMDRVRGTVLSASIWDQSQTKGMHGNGMCCTTAKAHVALSAGLASFLQQLPRQQLHGMQECPGGLASYEVAVGDARRS